MLAKTCFTQSIIYITHAHTRARARARTYTYMHIHTHTHTHTHMLFFYLTIEILSCLRMITNNVF